MICQKHNKLCCMILTEMFTQHVISIPHKTNIPTTFNQIHSHVHLGFASSFKLFHVLLVSKSLLLISKSLLVQQFLKCFLCLLCFQSFNSLISSSNKKPFTTSLIAHSLMSMVKKLNFSSTPIISRLHCISSPMHRLLTPKPHKIWASPNTLSCHPLHLPLPT